MRFFVFAVALSFGVGQSLAAQNGTSGPEVEAETVAPGERLELWRGLTRGMSIDEVTKVVLTFDGVKKAKFKGNEMLGYLDVDTKWEFTIAGRRSSFRPIFRSNSLDAVEINLGTQGDCVIGAVEGYNLSHDLLTSKYTLIEGTSKVEQGQVDRLKAAGAVNALSGRPQTKLHTFNSLYSGADGLLIMKSLEVYGLRRLKDAFLNKTASCSDHDYTTGQTTLTYLMASDAIAASETAEKARQDEIESLADDL